MKLIQKGNSKLIASDMMMFNLPATKEVCGRSCSGCYAIKEQKVYPTVLPARQMRYEASKDSSFVDTVHSELSKRKKRPKYFRVHASGEFYSQEYINAWETIAKNNSDITFYAYTKRKKNYDFSALESLNNFVLIDSLFFKGLNYGKLDQVPAGAFVCPDQKGANVSCGVQCQWCMTKGKADVHGVWFVKH